MLFKLTAYYNNMDALKKNSYKLDIVDIFHKFL